MEAKQDGSPAVIKAHWRDTQADFLLTQSGFFGSGSHSRSKAMTLKCPHLNAARVFLCEMRSTFMTRSNQFPSALKSQAGRYLLQNVCAVFTGETGGESCKTRGLYERGVPKRTPWKMGWKLIGATSKWALELQHISSFAFVIAGTPQKLHCS